MEAGEVWERSNENKKYAPIVRITKLSDVLGKNMVSVKPTKPYHETYVAMMSVKVFTDNYAPKKTKRKRG